MTEFTWHGSQEQPCLVMLLDVVRRLIPNMEILECQLIANFSANNKQEEINSGNCNLCQAITSVQGLQKLCSSVIMVWKVRGEKDPNLAAPVLANLGAFFFFFGRRPFSVSGGNHNACAA